MCGIFGLTNLLKKQLKQAHAALHTLAHRGPDGWNHAYTDQVYLGHRRLSIVDLSANGTQPMVAEGVYLTVNGEIYNFPALRAELEQQHQIKFTSHSDSEVLLHGYRVWGWRELLTRVDGMFALAIYDSNTQTVLLARDHAGIKPLYYSLLNGQLGWASELKALMNFYGEENLQIDHTAVYDFLSYLCIPAPKSLYQGIYKLPPATALIYDLPTQTHTMHRYWELPVGRTLRNPATAAQLIQTSLTQAVKEQLMSDVPLGTFLSGGVDSSIITYEAAQLAKQSGNGPLTTCSIGFADRAVDETAFALQVAKQLGTKHVTAQMNQNLVTAQFDKLKTLFDEPFGDSSAFPTLQVSALAKQHMTVVLTGDGGDELFGGYVHYKKRYMALTPWLGFLAPLRPLLSWAKQANLGFVSKVARGLEIFSIVNPLERQIRLRGGVLKTDALKRRFRKAYQIPEGYDELWYLRPHYRPDLPWRSRAMYLDFHTVMVEGFLTKVDRASMAVAIETRVPFLAKAVIAAAWQLHESLVFQDGELKGFLKALYVGRLPQNCLYRTKQGFSVGKAKAGDALHVANKSLPEVILRRLFPALLAKVPT
jgi:asparagine synthase (glutamine-hydrolysing)